MSTETANNGKYDPWPTGGMVEMLLKHAAFSRQRQLEKEFDELVGSPISPESKTWLKKLLDDARKQHVGQRTDVRGKKTLRKTILVAAIIFMFLLALPTVLFALSPEFRNFVMEWYEGHVNITVSNNVENAFVRYYVPSYIPDGFVLVHTEDRGIDFTLMYAQDEQLISFKTTDISTEISSDTETAEYNFECKINGCPAIVREDMGMTLVLWYDDKTFYSIRTTLTKEAALAIAGSVYWQEVLP